MLLRSERYLGNDLSAHRKGSALCRTSAQYYKDNKAWYGVPQAGDQVFFYDSSNVINHTGIVESVSGGIVYTIEGNTSDKVARRAYAIGVKNIAGYGRPKWSVVSDQTANDESGEIIVEPTDNSITLPVLKKGDKGECVRAAQILLRGRDCSVGVWGADGDFGNGTEGGVTTFQRRKGLKVTGNVDLPTWKALLGV